MNDTTPRAEALFHHLLMARSGEERLRMGCSMFDAARQMVIAGIKAEYGELNDTELKVQLLLRTYGADLKRERLDRVIARIRRAA